MIIKCGLILIILHTPSPWYVATACASLHSGLRAFEPGLQMFQLRAGGRGAALLVKDSTCQLLFCCCDARRHFPVSPRLLHNNNKKNRLAFFFFCGVLHRERAIKLQLRVCLPPAGQQALLEPPPDTGRQGSGCRRHQGVISVCSYIPTD